MEGPHNYLSTACAHELHERCRRTCKFCSTPCLCSCHPKALELDSTVSTTTELAVGLRKVDPPTENEP